MPYNFVECPAVCFGQPSTLLNATKFCRFEIDGLDALQQRHPFASISSIPALGKKPAQPLFDLARLASEEQLRVIRIKGDGRCMFRALALGLARNHGRILGPAAEEAEADQLRLAVAEALCRTQQRRNEFGAAVLSLQAEDSLQNYCRRILSPTFWGGEPELLVLSKMLSVPIYVYVAKSDAGRSGHGYVPIQKYGEEFSKPKKNGKKRRPVRLLYTNGNHYDLLLK